ncbi:MAG: glycosyl hydrolase [bacterium]|nr:glycosyl hydrolase [bacterium]
MRFMVSLCLLCISIVLWLAHCQKTNGADIYFDSPFGIHGKTFELGMPKNPPPGLKENITAQYEKLGVKTGSDWNTKIAAFEKELGIRWDRMGIGFMMADDIFSRTDNIVKNANKVGVNVLFTVSYQNRPMPGTAESDRIQQLVERYDGDGVDDMPGLTKPVLYWQIGNEPENRVDATEYLELLKIGYTAVKNASSKCQVLIAGLDIQMNSQPNFLATILESGGANYFDILDIHAFGNAQGDYRQIEQKVTDAQKIMKHYGVNKPIWITETGTASGSYNFPMHPEQQLSQTEKAQAIDLVRRYILSFGLGVKKVFWAWGLIEDYGFMNKIDGYFDHTGLIYNGLGLADEGPWVKKLSYYAYKKMTEKLEGADWSKTSRLTNLPAGVYGVQFTKAGKPIYVVWVDNASQASVTLTLPGLTANKVTITEAIPNYETGKKVTNYATAFVTTSASVQNGKLNLVLKDKPVYIE